jgi:hypothetical protein
LTGPDPVADDEAEADGDPAAELLAPPVAADELLDELQPAAASGMHSNPTTAALRGMLPNHRARPDP